MKKQTVGDWMAAIVGLVFLLTGPAKANNIAVTNVTLSRQNTEAKTVNVAFDLSWANSWRGSENWDAAWLFVKFRAPGSNNWQHATLSTNSADHAPAASSTIAAVPDGKGVFVYRSSGYTGTVNYAQMRLLWNYGTNGYSFAKGALVEVSVHAIEMVYVSSGSFYLGSGGGEASPFYQYPTTNAPYLVTNENAISVSAANGNLYYSSTAQSYGNPGDAVGPIPDAFPKGYAAFYCMKYEITQGQYADFLNKLTGTQWTNRYATGNGNYGNYRYRITGTCTNSSSDRPDRACNYLSWPDVVAYADWSALRPMTELEFEKACRGPTYPVTNEFAWGSATIIPSGALTLSGTEDGTETVTTSAALGGCNYIIATPSVIGGDGGNGGPLRVGIFATNNANRVQAGASYYGIMELTGNGWERTVTVGNANGRLFTGALGDGVLASTGAADTPNWPLLDNDTSGAGERGGFNDNSGSAWLRVSDRYRAVGVYAQRTTFNGGRAVRQAP